MLKTCFDHVCGQIINLVEKQIEDVEERGDSVKVNTSRNAVKPNADFLQGRSSCWRIWQEQLPPSKIGVRWYDQAEKHSDSPE